MKMGILDHSVRNARKQTQGICLRSNISTFPVKSCTPFSNYVSYSALSLPEVYRGFVFFQF